jgi:uncharacterized protein YbgA (DUF1722 family)
MRLVSEDGRLRLLTVKTGVDLTDRFRRYADRRVRQLDQEHLSGYVFKKDSPSCGIQRVKVYDGPGAPTRSGQGLFAAAVRARYPHLPLEDEGRLCDPRLRENFVERVFAYHRLRAFFSARWTVGGLVRFHTAQKLTLMAHQVTAYQRLGRLVAGAKGMAPRDVEDQYVDTYMRALATLATPGRHANVLQHMAGYVSAGLDAPSRAELAGTIDDYRRGLVPLIVPLTLLRHHVRVQDVSYLAGQAYLQPHPKELGLRNHV